KVGRKSRRLTKPKPKKKKQVAQFQYPEIEDRDNSVAQSSVILDLGAPISVAASSRSLHAVMFAVDLANYNVQ
ncbi:Hypothetical protein FKW44_012547, partial [Caligus rogercresseyi]